jgi:5'-deoxynucleotidase YfbR-like HD superfamily hydrolase
MTSHELIQKLLNLQDAYARVIRNTVTNERLRNSLLSGVKEIDLRDKKLREPLLEHVGHLPMIATFLHSHIENSSKVNLGRALIMLAIHDIGETVVGDIITYKKTKEDDEKESIAAQKLLSEDLFEYYKELGECKSLDAKFAWAVDTLGPFLYELESPNMTRRRFVENGMSSDIVENKKKVYFEWDSVLFDIFNICINTFRDIESNKSSNFAVGPDLPINM